MAALSRHRTSIFATINGVFNHLTPSSPSLLRLITLRSYRIATAAQPQFDDDRYYNDVVSVAGDPKTPAPALDSDGSIPMRGVQWVFIGKPNAKRRVYADMISKLVEVPHISITTLLRLDLNPRSSIYKQIAGAVNCGKLVPESIIFGLLSKRMEDGHDRGETGFILDGIPRTRLQAEILDQMVDIDLVVNFKCSEDYFYASESRFDSSVSSDKSTHKTKTISSSDNPTEDAGPRISTFYKEQMKSLKDYYQNQKKLIEFDVGNAPGDTWKGLIAALHLQHLNAVSSSQALPLDFRVP